MPAEIRFEVNADDFVQKLAQLGPALDDAMRLAVGDIQIRITDHARSTTLFKDGVGSAGLRGSILAPPVEGSFSDGELRAKIVAGGGTVHYARFVHDGTKPHEIKPKKRRALRIPTGTGFAFRKKVRHPGTAPRPFMTVARDAIAPQVPALVEAYLQRAIRIAGLT